MKETFVIADLPLRVNVCDGLRAWRAISPRFSPFAAPVYGEAALDADVKCGPLPTPSGTLVYDPPYTGVGVAVGKVYLQDDGNFEIEFWTLGKSPKARLWMRLLLDQARAEIVLEQDGESKAAHFLSHSLMVAFMIAAMRHSTLIMHASCVVLDGKAYLFQGKSGTGKSTHSRMWLENVPGSELLNDDNPLIALQPDGMPRVYGSPWSGKTDCYRNASAPVGAFVRIVRADRNELCRLSSWQAYASLATSLPLLPFLNDEFKGLRRRAIECLVATVPCCKMLCQPNPAAAQACLNGLTSLKSIQI